jgi:hypothetical protein
MFADNTMKSFSAVRDSVAPCGVLTKGRKKNKKLGLAGSKQINNL